MRCTTPLYRKSRQVRGQMNRRKLITYASATAVQAFAMNRPFASQTRTRLQGVPLASSEPITSNVEAVQASSKETKMKRVHAGVLDVTCLESGSSSGSPVILLHGFPYDVHSYDRAAESLASQGFRVIVPYLRGYGPTRFLRDATPRVGQQAALGSDLLALLDALSIERATLAGYDWGGRAACVVAALWPERVSGLVSCGTGYNLQNSAEALKPIEPQKERLHWYWFYLNSERGKAALAQDRSNLCRYLWKDFSPTWDFDEATYRQTSSSFDNPDFVDVVLHSYRQRIGAVAGAPSRAPREKRL